MLLIPVSVVSGTGVESSTEESTPVLISEVNAPAIDEITSVGIVMLVVG